MHILDIIGWACVGMIAIVSIMHLAVDSAVRSANAAIITMFTMLALASFMAGFEAKSTDWVGFHGVVQSATDSPEHLDGREIVFDVPGIPKEIEAFSVTDDRYVYLCRGEACTHLHPGVEIFFERKWAGPEHGWLMREIKFVDK